MPIKWNALLVNDAMDMVQEFFDQAVEPLEQARTVAREARNIPNLPQYVDQHLLRIISEIDRTIGGSDWDPTGQIMAGIQSVRDSLPDGAVESEKKKIEAGSQPTLGA
jgi:hypothetical protein